MNGFPQMNSKVLAASKGMKQMKQPKEKAPQKSPKRKSSIISGITVTLGGDKNHTQLRRGRVRERGEESGKRKT